MVPVQEHAKKNRSKFNTTVKPPLRTASETTSPSYLFAVHCDPWMPVYLPVQISHKQYGRINLILKTGFQISKQESKDPAKASNCYFYRFRRQCLSCWLYDVSTKDGVRVTERGPPLKSSTYKVHEVSTSIDLNIHASRSDTKAISLYK